MCDNNNKEKVSFVCQKCFHPITIDQSLRDLNESHLTQLKIADPLNSQLEVEDLGTCDFLVVNDKDQVDVIDRKIRLQTQLFNLLSEKSNIDQPLCEECAEQFFRLLEEHYNAASSDLDEYTNFFRTTPSLDSLVSEIEPLKIELDKQLAEEKQLTAELESLDAEEAKMNVLIAEETKLLESLVQKEDNYWKSYIKERFQLLKLDDDIQNLESKIRNTEQEVNELKKTNVFNAAFNIWNHGHFGTINNFRLGRLPTEPVDWSEINAACGQAALLLNAMARKINLQFANYRIVPHGSQSYIESINDKKKLPLYYVGGVKYLWSTRFDAGMVAFLDCVRQFQDVVQKTKTRLPYQIDKDRIFDQDTSYSVKIVLNTDDQWTKALKFLLTNLRWCLAWILSEMTAEDSAIDHSSSPN